jgi:hypothetical protein
MKVMISSVRRGLEPERDALAGLIMALGHEPLAPRWQFRLLSRRPSSSWRSNEGCRMRASRRRH